MTEEEAKQKILSMDVSKDYQDFQETFGQYEGKSWSNWTEADKVEWMVDVVRELMRLNSKVNFLIKQYQQSLR